MYKAIKTNARTLIPEVIDVDFEIKGEYIYVSKGAVTGYESASVRDIVKQYVEMSVFTCWTACSGTLNKYPRLEIPMSEIIKFLQDKELITVEKDYGYIKNITLSDNLTQKVKEE